MYSIKGAGKKRKPKGKIYLPDFCMKECCGRQFVATDPSYKGKVIFLEYIVTKNGTFKEVENEFGMKNQPFQFNRIIPNSKPRETKTLSKP